MEKLVKANHPLGIILKAKTYMADGDWSIAAFMLSKPPINKMPEAQHQLGAYLFLSFMNQSDPDLKEHLRENSSLPYGPRPTSITEKRSTSLLPF